MMETLLTLVSVALGSSGLSAIIVAILNHRWAVKKGASTKLDGMIAGDNMERYVLRQLGIPRLMTCPSDFCLLESSL